MFTCIARGLLRIVDLIKYLRTQDVVVIIVLKCCILWVAKLIQSILIDFYLIQIF